MEILKTQFIQGFMRMCSDGYKLAGMSRMVEILPNSELK